jgi:hypothetical protein
MASLVFLSRICAILKIFGASKHAKSVCPDEKFSIIGIPARPRTTVE